jgi:hypothetical protein
VIYVYDGPMRSNAKALHIVSLAFIFSIPGTAGIIYSGPSYFQDFDTLSSVKSSVDLTWTERFYVSWMVPIRSAGAWNRGDGLQSRRR